VETVNKEQQSESAQSATHVAKMVDVTSMKAF